MIVVVPMGGVIEELNKMQEVTAAVLPVVIAAPKAMTPYCSFGIKNMCSKGNLTFIAVFLASSSTPRHLAWVGCVASVCTCTPLAVAETSLSLSIDLAILVIGWLP